MKYRVYRTLTTVQYTIVEADTPGDAVNAATWNPHLLEWVISSENDPDIMDVVEEA
jgi:hypothetical protein